MSVHTVWMASGSPKRSLFARVGVRAERGVEREEGRWWAAKEGVERRSRIRGVVVVLASGVGEAVEWAVQQGVGRVCWFVGGSDGGLFLWRVGCSTPLRQERRVDQTLGGRLVVVIGGWLAWREESRLVDETVVSFLCGDRDPGVSRRRRAAAWAGSRIQRSSWRVWSHCRRI